MCAAAAILIVITVEMEKKDMDWIEILPPRSQDFHGFTVLFTEEAKLFLGRLVREFDKEVEEILRNRKLIKLQFDQSENLPTFQTSLARSDSTWKIAPLPKRLLKRHLDLGDVSPADTERFSECLRQDVDGIQTDFDDGHSPTWHNQVQGWPCRWTQLRDVPTMENWRRLLY